MPRVLLCALALTLLAGCGGGAAGTGPNAAAPSGASTQAPVTVPAAVAGPKPVGVTAGDMAELQAALQRQTTAATAAFGPPAGSDVQPLPQAYWGGDTNADGTPAVTLIWQGELPGDMDFDGQVTDKDLLPLAANLGLTSGDCHLPPLVDSNSPAAAAYFARLDGNGNRQIEFGDVVTVARHYHQQLDGYQVFRRELGTGSWIQLPNPADPQSPLSITQAQAAANPSPEFRGLPVNYTYVDHTAPATEVEYRVVPYGVGVADEADASWSVPLRYYPDLAPRPAPVVSLPGDGAVPLLIAGNNVATVAAGSADDNWPLSFVAALDGGAEAPVGQVSDPNTSLSIPLENNTPGRHTLRVRATDSIGREGFAQSAYTLRIKNAPPTIDPHLILGNAIAPQHLNIDLGGSGDPDGDPWDYKMVITNPAGDISGLYVSLPGHYSVVVTAWDEFGATSTWTQNFTLAAGQTTAPGWTFADLPAVASGDKFAVGLINGCPALAVDQLRKWYYLQAADAAGDNWRPGETLITGGVVPDFEGARLLQVGERPATYLQWRGSNYYCVAREGTGSQQWYGPIALGNASSSGSGLAQNGDMTVLDGKPTLAYSDFRNVWTRRASDQYGLTWSDPVQLPRPSPVMIWPSLNFATIDGQTTICAAGNFGDGKSSWGTAVWSYNSGAGGSWNAPRLMNVTAGANPWVNFIVSAPPWKPLVRSEGLSQQGILAPLIERPVDPQARLWSPAQAVPVNLALGQSWGYSQDDKRYDIALVDNIPCAAYIDASTLQLVFVEAEDAYGTAWNSPVVLDNRGGCGFGVKLLEVQRQPAVVYSVHEAWGTDGEPTDAGLLRYAHRTS